jgi:hypothetical protein
MAIAMSPSIGSVKDARATAEPLAYSDKICYRTLLRLPSSVRPKMVAASVL